MKKVHSLIIAMLFITYCTKAQIRAGLKAGINLSSIKGSDFNDPAQKTLMGWLSGAW